VRALRKILRSRDLKKNQRGSAAVEFAMVALPFMAMMFGLFEIMMIFFVQTALESAVAEESRKVKTGQASTGAGINAATFKANVCARMMGMVDCTNRLFVMVETQPLAGTLPSPFTTPSILGAPPYNQNTLPNAIVVVRGYYMWPLLTPGIAEVFKNTSTTGPNGDLGDKNRLLVATSAFRNEPFQ
jgi:Flp pilus assembly protein TadG